MRSVSMRSPFLSYALSIYIMRKSTMFTADKIKLSNNDPFLLDHSAHYVLSGHGGNLICNLTRRKKLPALEIIGH